MKVFILILISIILLIFDVSLLPFFGIGEIYSSSLSIYFFIYCVNNEKYGIVFLSLFVGFLQDIFFHNIFGVNMMLNMIIGVVLYFISIKCNRNRKLFYIFIISFASIVKSLLIILYLLISSKINFNVFDLAYEFAHAFLLSLFMYPVFNSMFNNKLFKKILEF